MLGNRRLYRQVASAPATVVAGEAAVVTPTDSRLHILNEVGTRVWALCEGNGAAIDGIVEALLHEFEVTPEDARSATETFLEDAVARGILEVQHAID
jgi:ABC-type sulfate transport system substrate-binding protein